MAKNSGRCGAVIFTIAASVVAKALQESNDSLGIGTSKIKSRRGYVSLALMDVFSGE